MRKLLCLLLTVLFLPIASAWAEGAAMTIVPLSEAVRPGKAITLSFTVPEDGVCSLTLKDMAGNFVMDVVSGMQAYAGENQVWWNGTSMGVSPQEGVYQLVLAMNGQEASSTVVIGAQAPYLTSIVPVKDADTMTMTLNFYASVDGLLTVGLWSGNVWALLENRQIVGGMNQVVWDASGIGENTTALTLTLTDATGFSSNEEHIGVTPADFGLTFATPVPAATPAPAQEEAADPAFETPVFIDPGQGLLGAEITPAPTEEPTPEPTAEPTPEPAEASSDFFGWDDPIVIDTSDAEEIENAGPAFTPVPAMDVTFTPSYGSPYPFTEKDQGTYWATPMDITDEAAIWEMLTAPITVYDATYKGQRKIYQEPSEKSRVVGVVTGTSQGVRVIENLDNGWSLIECYSSTFHDNSIQAWNMLIQGYVKTSALKTHDVSDKYHIVVDKLTQRLYLFGEGRLLTTLLVSTGLSNERQPYNETRSGEFLYISATGGFWSDNMFAPMGMKFNDGDLLHEVPYVQRSNSNSRIYTTTEPFLGSRASHGCIRVQRKTNSDGYNMEWIWDHRKDIGRLVVWEDWQGRQIAYPAEDTVLYLNPKGGTYYHKADHCDSAKAGTVFEAFTYAELDTGKYAKLEFCPYCAPALRKAEIDEINMTHAWGGDHDPILTAARQKYLDKLVEKHGLDGLTEGEKRYYDPYAAQ
ncbi:MAG: L,D-transpeptidase [Clostridia bacterium]|nr:L,D-transpeptidase [Clostridia bacterium]